MYIVMHMTPASQQLGKCVPKVTLSTTVEILKAIVVHCYTALH
jgi:hypothetical protein